MTTLHQATGLHLAKAQIEQAKFGAPKPVKAPKHRHQWRRGPGSICLICGRKKPAKSERRKLELANLQLCKEIVLERDQGCVTPPPENGHSKVRQSGHVFSVVFGSVEFGLDNQNEQCSGCNGRHENFPNIYFDWYKDKFGQEKFDSLWREAQITIKYTVAELETINFELTEIQKYQQSHPGWEPYYSQKEILSGDWKQNHCTFFESTVKSLNSKLEDVTAEVGQLDIAHAR